MARWHTLRPVDTGFFDTAPVRAVIETELPARPERVWASLTSDRSVSEWSPAIRAVSWLSPRPFGVGTTREVVLVGRAVRMRERFVRWDEDAPRFGYAFCGTESDKPGLAAFGEDYVVEPGSSAGTTRLVWTIALEPAAWALPLRWSAPVVKAAFARVAADGGRFFAQHP